MSKDKSSLHAMLVLGNQLFDPKKIQKEKVDCVIMIEDVSLCTYVKHHKQKILLFLSAMRSYREELEALGIKVFYQNIEASIQNTGFQPGKNFSGYESYFLGLLAIIKSKLKDKYTDIQFSFFEIEDKVFEKEVHAFFQKHDLNFRVIQSPLFICSREDFAKYLSSSKKPFMKTFYEQQRKNRGVLLDEKKRPLGGKWSFDADNRLKLPKNVELPKDCSWKASDHTSNLIPIIEKYFADHPGELEVFNWPTTRKQTNALVQSFLEDRLEYFGPYEDAISKRSDSLFHSRLSASLNLGLVDPLELVKKVESLDECALSSREGFIRQVMGWREFIRGIYQNFSEEQESLNFWKHERWLKKCWYDASTGVEFLDYTITKIQRTAYAHHIERLMILSSTMLLLEVHPKEVYKWFMEMFIDSSEWVMVPNVYGMGQYADGGIFATKPYICGSNYLIKMSDYLKKGEWSDSMDALYWDFIGKHLDFYAKNPRMSVMVKQYEKFSPSRKLDIKKLAASVRDQWTY